MKRPKVITAAAILALVLLLAGAVWPLVGGDQLFQHDNAVRPGGSLPQGVPAEMPGKGSVPQMGSAQTAPGGFPENGPATGSQNGIGGSGLNSIMRVLEYVLFVLVIILGLLAFGGLWTQKRWGSVMAIITSVIVVVMSVTAFFGPFLTVTLIESIAKMIISITVIVLVLLPGAKMIQTENA
jgi:hypothetical protein